MHEKANLIMAMISSTRSGVGHGRRLSKTFINSVARVFGGDDDNDDEAADDDIDEELLEMELTSSPG